MVYFYIIGIFLFLFLATNNNPSVLSVAAKVIFQPWASDRYGGECTDVVEYGNPVPVLLTVEDYSPVQQNAFLRHAMKKYLKLRR